MWVVDARHVDESYSGDYFPIFETMSLFSNETLRLFKESDASDDEWLNSFQLRDDIGEDACTWDLKRNCGGWDIYYPWGIPLVEDDGIFKEFNEFLSEADPELLEQAKAKAVNGSNQALFDAYQALSNDEAVDYGFPNLPFDEFVF